MIIDKIEEAVRQPIALVDRLLSLDFQSNFRNNVVQSKYFIFQTQRIMNMFVNGTLIFFTLKQAQEFLILQIFINSHLGRI